MKNVLMILAVALLGSGCATGRLADLRDCGKLSLGVGLGLEAEAKAGIVIHPSLGIYSVTHRAGFDDRYVAGAWSEGQAVWPTMSLIALFASLFSWDGQDSDWDLTSFVRGRERGDRIYPEYYTSWLPWLVPSPQDYADDDPTLFYELTDVEIGGTLGIVSARVGINPLEILDFLLGLAGMDIAGDDPKEEQKPDKGKTEAAAGDHRVEDKATSQR